MRALAMKLAVGRVQSTPFSDELISAGRELLFTALEFAGSKLPVRERQGGQPFFLAAIEEFLRISGDPDSRAFYTDSTHQATPLLKECVWGQMPNCLAFLLYLRRRLSGDNTKKKRAA